MGKQCVHAGPRHRIADAMQMRAGGAWPSSDPSYWPSQRNPSDAFARAMSWVARQVVVTVRWP